MKNYKNYFLALFLGLGSAITVVAQDDMEVVWEKKYDHAAESFGLGLEGEYSYIADDKEISLISNESGEIKWTKPFKEIAERLKKVDAIVPLWDANAIFLFDQKMGKEQIAVADLATGNAIWASDSYKGITPQSVTYIKEYDVFLFDLKDGLHCVDAKTGKVKWENSSFIGKTASLYLTDKEEGSMTMVNIQSANWFAFKGWKNQLMKIDMNTGKTVWENVYRGEVEKKVFTGELLLYNLSVKDGKVFLKLNGLQVFDYKSGKNLWTAAFDFTPDGGLNRGSYSDNSFKRTYGAVAQPFAEGDDIFVLDMSSKSKQYLKKYDKHTGKLIWTSADFNKTKAIPTMFMMGNVVILQIGGMLEQHIKSTSTNSQTGGSSVSNSIEYNRVGPFGLKAINVATGKLVWESEKFKKGISNIVDDNGTLIVASSKVIYKIDPKSGEVKYEKALKGDGIGNANVLFPLDSQVLIVGDKGVSKHNVESGKLEGSVKWKKAGLFSIKNGYVILITAKKDVAAINVETLKVNVHDAKKDTGAKISVNGDYLYLFRKKTIVKLKVY